MKRPRVLKSQFIRNILLYLKLANWLAVFFLFVSCGKGLRIKPNDPALQINESTNSNVDTNAAPVASELTITDSNGNDLEIGDELSGSYIYSDEENDLEGTTTFRWLRSGTAIEGATEQTYTLQAEDTGHSLIFEVTPMALTGTLQGSTYTSDEIAIGNKIPIASSVSITDDNGGSINLGDQLTGSYAYTDTENDLEGTSTFRWLRDGVAISGATSTTYTLIASDFPKSIQFEVTPVASTGAATGIPVKSSSLVTPNLAPTASSVSITDGNGGNAEVGDTLTGTYTYADNESDSEGTSTFRWLRDATPISGATASNYTVQSADSLATIVFEVTPVATAGTLTGTATSSAGVSVVNLAPVASSVSITDGNGAPASQGDLLTGNYTYSDNESDAEGTTTFRWLRDSVAISGATNSTYTLVAADVGTSVTFEVTPVASAGTTTGSPVSSGAIVVNNLAPTASSVSISDGNGGYAVQGDTLTGSYSYADNEADAEGTSTFRWLRDSVAISGATAISYTLVSADVYTKIQFEVTPIASTGTTNGSATLSSNLATGTPPKVSTTVAAIYYDTNKNSSLDSGDTIILTFDQNLTLSSSDINDLDLPVTGDSFGSSATYTAGPSSSQLTINPSTAGTPFLKSRQNYNGGQLTQNSPTGIDVSSSLSTGLITGGSGLDAITSTPKDLIPGFVDTAQSIGSANTTYSLDLGDVDGDGDLDLITANYSQVNKVYTNNGSGAYTDSAQSLGGTSDNTQMVVLVDVDKDGDLDALFANNSSTANALFLNNGSGVYSDSGQSLGSSSTTSIATGDVDQDGDIDFVAGNMSQADLVYLNDGAGTFTNSGQSLGSASTTSVALSDLDSDGDLDLVIGHNSGEANSVYFNNGSGTFTDSAQTLGISNTSDIDLADVDKDGDIDIVCLNDGAPDKVYLNNGLGTMTDSGQSLGTTESSQSGSLFDYDQDGDLDLIVGISGGENKLYLNSGSGTFSDSTLLIGSASLNTYTTSFGDSDADGDADLFFANINGNNQIFASSLSGTWGNAGFSSTGQAIGANTDVTKKTVLGDIDNDGDLDIALANNGQNNLIFLNNGSGTFTDSGQSIGGTKSSQGADLGDIDGDGDLDLVIANNGSNIVYLNNGTGTMADSGQTLGSENTWDIILVDVDLDGDLDLITANYGNANVVYLNDGSGTFSANESLGTYDSVSMVSGDLNNDGYPDIVIGNYGQGNRVYMNDGDGTFTDTSQSMGTDQSLGIDLGDIDGDGDLDLVVANWSTTANKIYMNDGTGTFTDSGQSLGANNSSSLALKDFDGDGVLELIVNNNVSLIYYENNGSGTFSADQTISSDQTTSDSISVGDVDGDGDMDFVLGNDSEQDNIFLNQ